jgi:hypothetical protein
VALLPSNNDPSCNTHGKTGRVLFLGVFSQFLQVAELVEATYFHLFFFSFCLATKAKKQKKKSRLWMKKNKK